MPHQLEGPLREPREAMAAMAAAARGILGAAVALLDERRPADVEAVLARDVELNRFGLRLDHTCERLLVLRWPFAVDFRIVFGTIEVTRDLERVGDESKVVARWAGRLHGPASGALHRMATSTRALLDAACEALLASDDRAAERIFAADLLLDRHEAQILDTTHSRAEAFVAHALERIGDRAENIAENVIYVVRAKDVRHPDAR